MITLPLFPNRLEWVVPALCLLSLGAAAQEPVIPVQLVAVQFTTLSAELPAKIDRINVKEPLAAEEAS
jgi:membrane fusion protein (multidrug efflux system)